MKEWAAYKLGGAYFIMRDKGDGTADLNFKQFNAWEDDDDNFPEAKGAVALIQFLNHGSMDDTTIQRNADQLYHAPDGWVYFTNKQICDDQQMKVAG